MPKCEICGELMPPGEEMFKFHGYSGPCPKPPIPREQIELNRAIDEVSYADLRASGGIIGDC